MLDRDRGPVAAGDAVITPHSFNHTRNRITCDTRRDPKCDFTHTGHWGHRLRGIDRNGLPTQIQPQPRGGGAFDAGCPDGNSSLRIASIIHATESPAPLAGARNAISPTPALWDTGCAESIATGCPPRFNHSRC